MIRCREVAELLTSDRLQAVRVRVRLEVRLHLWMCRYCARLARQVEQLRAAAARLAGTFGPRETGTPEGAFEERLVQRLSNKG
jgi:hypothetical protein